MASIKFLEALNLAVPLSAGSGGLGANASSFNGILQMASGVASVIASSTFGRSWLNIADAAAGRTALGLGTLATQSGTFSGTSSGTNTGDQTITLTGDVTGSGTGSFAATIANGAVTYAKMQNVSATDRILGRSSAGAGVVQEIVCTSFARTILDDADAVSVRNTIGLGVLDNVEFRTLTTTQTSTNSILAIFQDPLTAVRMRSFSTRFASFQASSASTSIGMLNIAGSGGIFIEERVSGATLTVNSIGVLVPADWRWQIRTADVNGFVVTRESNSCIGRATAGTGATFNLALGGGTTSPVLGANTADVVHLAGVDNGAGNRELRIQPELGSALAYGNNVLRSLGTDLAIQASFEVALIGLNGGALRWEGDILNISHGSNGQRTRFFAPATLMTINVAAQTDATIIPAGVILALGIRVNVAIPGVSTFSVGTSVNPTEFASGLANTLNAEHVIYIDPKAFPVTTLRITPNTTPSTNAGRLRVTIHMYNIWSATS
jgi:hypothetical protein